MRKLYASLIALTFSLASSAQFCDPQGNVVIYSNYDGGPLTINVDQNIPNLKIGVLSYEFAKITITGTYASNVTAVWWVGYNGSNNHCNLPQPHATSITGVPDPVDSMLIYPPATFSNPNGYSLMICAASCNTTTDQGGCNTADQVAHYFLTKFGGSLYFHHTQYGCWGTMNISAGGNCCANPITEVAEADQTLFSLAPNPATNSVNVSMPSNADVQTIQITNMLGETVEQIQIAAGTTSQQIPLEGFAPGTYFFRMQSGETITTEKLVVTE
jgi:hypothetical protein